MMENGGRPGRRTVSRRRVVGTAAAAVAAAGAGVVGYLATPSDRDRAEALTARWHAGALPPDPGDPAWLRVAPVEIPLLPQKIVPPMLGEQVIAHLRLRVLHNGGEIAFHLEWQDAKVDELEAMGRFRDAVAVQLPVVTGTTPPAITMGGPGQPVHILHWKASWQADLDTGQKGVKDAFPNAFNDVYPEAVLGEAGARDFYPALAVGNLMARRDKTSSVEELVAVGFGTLTTHDQQRAKGRAAFADGRWRVVIALPMTGGKNQATIRPGSSTHVAVAAWDGAHGNRGARKQWSNWTSMHVERTA